MQNFIEKAYIQMGKNKVAQDSTLLLSKLEIIPSRSFTLSNGIPVLALHNEDYRLIRLDIRLLSEQGHKPIIIQLGDSKDIVYGQFSTRPQTNI